MAVLSLTVSETAGVPWLAGFLIAAPFAAAMSTVDSFMLMISSSLVRDIYQPYVNRNVSEHAVKLLSYGCTVAVGILVMLFAVNPPKFLQVLVVFTSGGLSSAFLVPIFLAVYWPRYNTESALAGMGVGFVAFIGFEIAKQLDRVPIAIDPMIVGVASSLVVSVAVALMTKPPAESIRQKFFGK